jgi:serine/threonine-protein kinase RIO1
VINEKYWYQRETGIDAHELTPQEAIAEAIKNNLVVEIYQIIGQGKEAFVCWGKDNSDRLVALKSYKIFRTTHRQQISNTPRTSPYGVISQFAELEYSKMHDMFKSGLPVPQAFKRFDFNFTMELIGDENGPSPLLKDIGKETFDDPVEILEKCIDILQAFFQKQYVHGDFSEHNLILQNDDLIAIDFLQSKKFALKDAVRYGSTLIPLTRAYRILQKDINSILLYFKRCFRIEVNSTEVVDYIVGNFRNKIQRELEFQLETRN